MANVLTIVRGTTPLLDHGQAMTNGIVQNLSGWTLRFTAKRKTSDSQAQAVIAKHSGVGGGMTITNAAEGRSETLILSTDTASITERTVLEYDIEGTDAVGGIYQFERGQLIVELDVTTATGGVGPPAEPPEPVTNGSFLQYNSGNVWSSWTLPITAPVLGDIGKVLAISAAGATAFPSGYYFTGGAAGTDGLDTRVPTNVTTTSATLTAILTYTPPANAVIRVIAHAIAHEPATGATCSRARTATFRIDSSVVTQVGSTVDADGGQEQDAGASAWQVTITTSGGTILVNIQGEAGKTIVWQPAIQLERLAA